MAVRYRCTACGNLTRFDVVTSRRTRLPPLHGGRGAVGGGRGGARRARRRGGLPVVRLGGVRRGARRGGGRRRRRRRGDAELSRETERALLRPALEVAVAVARQGEQATPRLPAPAALRPYLTFAKLPARALDTARRVLDEDEGFRRRVAEAVDRARLDAAGELALLVLDRPDGWEDELAAAVSAADAAEASTARQREDRRLERQLARTAERLEDAERRAAAAAADLDAARTALARERAARLGLEDRVDELARSLAAADAARSGAVRELKAAEERARRRTQEAADARARQHELELALAEAEAARRAPSEPAGVLDAVSEPEARLDAATEPETRRTAAAPGSETRREAAAPDLASVGGAVARAARAASELSAALAEASSALAGATSAAEPVVPPADAVTVPRSRRAVRRPVRLPSGVLDDTPDALAALVQVPHMLLLVDGYNVAKTGWPDLDLDLQRDRLVDGLVELEARTGVDVLVVFDGAEQAGPRTATSVPRSVQVRFSAAGVEADDVIIELVADLPASRPVTVVSSDRRVRSAVAGRGANTALASQLVAVLRRWPGAAPKAVRPPR
ncbi:MAG: NYN domain-containing protein [Acidimicrobiales bacterium]